MTSKWNLSIHISQNRAPGFARKVRYAACSVNEQTRLRVKYSSSERRTLIVRDRGFRTVIIDPQAWFELQNDPVYSQEFLKRMGKNENA